MSENPRPDFSLRDLNGKDHSFPDATPTLLCFVKEDCPTCNLVLPVIDEIARSNEIRVLVPGQTSEGNRQLQSRFQPAACILDDSILKVSFAYGVETVPMVLLCDENGIERDSLVGFDKKEWHSFYSKHFPGVAVDWSTLPEWQPGCGSLTQDPIIGERLLAESENSPLRARKIEIGTQDDVHEFMFDQGFTDGLPVVPPTPERVLEMLRGTERDPQEEITVIPPNMAPATVEKVAINAVLAGCKPEYLPVVIAALQALCTDEFNGHGVFATTMGASPVMVVNGPIRQRIGMAMGMSALGQGNRANASIGRALRLAVRNIGGAKPGGTERSTLGSPLKFTMCFAEWEERSPWEPLHVERGFQRDESVVTLFAMSGGPALIVDQASRQGKQLATSMGLSLRAQHHVRSHRAGDTLLVVSPEHGDTFARSNWEKQDVRAQIQSASSVPLRELIADDECPVGIPTIRAKELNKEELNKPVPKFASTRNIHLVFAGSEAGMFTSAFHGWASGPMGSIPTSQAIES
ncbi:MAG: TlpA family protein disulfide reductase [Gammaproteobacteria bacterium]|nr:TlpA family protein disulfide reductase [Gammaproteobacteria bacterium]